MSAKVAELLKGRIFVIDDFLSADECQNYLDIINQRHESERYFASESNFYNECFCESEIANTFYEKIQSYNLELNQEIVGACDYLAVAKFQSGEEFGIHTDTGTIDHEKGRESAYVLLIYLNYNYQGGLTEFYHDGSQGQAFTLWTHVEPKAGRALLFDIELWHRACPVVSGTKYWIGTDLMTHFSR